VYVDEGENSQLLLLLVIGVGFLEVGPALPAFYSRSVYIFLQM
jgi:hypothetical protein